jgi:Predicted membrane protein (DUF2127)
MAEKIKGKFTFRSTGVLFILSALIELYSITDPIPLFGALCSGVLAAAYHLVYGLLFLALGVGLVRASPWAYPLVFIATGVYSLDRIVYVLNRSSLEAYLVQQLSAYRDILQMLDLGIMVNLIITATLLGVACWWGLAFYTYLRRAYFKPKDTRPE